MSLALILAALSFVCSALPELSLSDPVEVSIRVNAMVPTPELIEQTRHELWLDRPIAERWLSWLAALAHGDLGLSFISRRPVTESFLEAVPATMILAGAALLIILAASIPAALVSIAHAGGPVDTLVRGFVFAATAVPAFCAGLFLIDVFALRLDLLPTSGMRSASSIVLPAVTLALAYAGTYTRLLRSEMIRTERADWVLFAKSCGMPQSELLCRILVNSLRGTISALTMSVPKLAAGAFVVETIFAWPGIGRLAVQAVFNRDLPVIQAYVFFTAILFVLCSLLGDLILYALDPRERVKSENLS